MVLDEAVLHRAVGGSSVMGAQLDISSRSQKCLMLRFRSSRIGAGAHPAMDSTFTILEFGDVPERRVR